MRRTGHGSAAQKKASSEYMPYVMASQSRDVGACPGVYSLKFCNPTIVGCTLKYRLNEEPSPACRLRSSSASCARVKKKRSSMCVGCWPPGIENS